MRLWPKDTLFWPKSANNAIDSTCKRVEFVFEFEFEFKPQFDGVNAVGVFLAESFSHLRNLLGWLASLSAHLAASPAPPLFFFFSSCFFFFFSICNSKCSSDLRFIIPMKAETLLPWFLFHFFGFLLSPASCCWLIKADTPHKVWFRRVLDDQEIKFNFIVAAPQ